MLWLFLLLLVVADTLGKIYRSGDRVPYFFYLLCAFIFNIAIWRTSCRLDWQEVQEIIDDYADIDDMHFVTGLFGANQGEFEFEYIKGTVVSGTTIHPTASVSLLPCPFKRVN